jgi:hypothetical protein
MLPHMRFSLKWALAAMAYVAFLLTVAPAPYDPYNRTGSVIPAGLEFN